MYSVSAVKCKVAVRSFKAFFSNIVSTYRDGKQYCQILKCQIKEVLGHWADHFPAFLVGCLTSKSDLVIL